MQRDKSLVCNKTLSSSSLRNKINQKETMRSEIRNPPQDALDSSSLSPFILFVVVNDGHFCNLHTLVFNVYSPCEYFSFFRRG